MKKYNRLTIREREEIYKLYHKGKSYREIGCLTGRDVSTISRELRRNTYRYDNIYHGYWPSTAQDLSQIRSSKRKRGKCKIAMCPPLREEVLSKLALRWSPEQISSYLTMKYPEDKKMHISHESIYTYVYILGRGSLKKELYHYLRQKKRDRNYMRRDKSKARFKDMLSIDERPSNVEERIIPGHWEGDLIIGKGQKSALGTIVERTTRLVIMVPLKSRDAETVRKAFARELKRLPKQVRLSMTYDQGSEMSQHNLFTKSTQMKVYFAHPHSPWERGTNENTNMLIRDFFPKSTDFNQVSKYQIKKVQQMLNERPRKILNWKTPKEVYQEILRESG